MAGAEVELLATDQPGGEHQQSGTDSEAQSSGVPLTTDKDQQDADSLVDPGNA